MRDASASPLLDHCPAGLPQAAYLAADWFAAELRTVWARNWVQAGRLSDLAPGRMRAVTVAGAGVILCRLADGGLRAWHNSCRHRGAELCAGDGALGAVIRCPYHAWAYAAADGRLVSVGLATPGADFDRAAHGLVPVAVQVWAGFVWLKLSPAPRPLAPDSGPDALDHWPMDMLVTGHRSERVIDCNWKVFWENYNECLHCPGIHPELCDRVPVYRRGVMSAAETPDPVEGPALAGGAVSWTPGGAPCGPVFAGLTADERAEGHRFVTLYPACYIVAHVDHVRAVTLTPLGPERTRLTAEWLFAPDTLAQPGFDAANIAGFAQTVMDQDAAVTEMNQRGLRSLSFAAARLMPQEFDIARFHHWVRAEMEAIP